MSDGGDGTAGVVSGPRLWITLARAYGAVAEYVAASVAAEGLGLSDFAVLELLLHKGPRTISEIGEKVLLANASMTAAVDRLEARGWVERRLCEADRRTRIVALTEAGREFIAGVYERHACDIERVMGVLEPGEKEELRRLLKKLGYAAREAAAKRNDRG